MFLSLLKVLSDPGTLKYSSKILVKFVSVKCIVHRACTGARGHLEDESDRAYLLILTPLKIEVASICNLRVA